MTRIDYIFAGYDAGIHGLPDELIAARTTHQRLLEHQIPPAPTLDGLDSAVDELVTAARNGGDLLTRVDQTSTLADQRAAQTAGLALRTAREQTKAALEALGFDLRDTIISEYLRPAFKAAVEQGRADGNAARNAGLSPLAVAKADAKTRAAIVRFDQAASTYTQLRTTWSRLVMQPPGPEFADRLPVFGEIRNVAEAWPEFTTRLNAAQLRQRAPWLDQPDYRSRLIWLATHPEAEAWMPTPDEHDALVAAVYAEQLEAGARAHFAGQAVAAWGAGRAGG